MNIIKELFQNKKDGFYGKIQDMMLFIKKWWLLENLRKEIYRNSGECPLDELASGQRILLTSQFFVAGRKDLPQYPGLAEKSFWGKKKYSDNELKKRVQEYYDILNVCEEEGYIKMVDAEKDGQTTKVPIPATSKAHKISGWPGLLEGLLSEYKSIWTMIFLPIITFILGLIWDKIF